MIDPNYLQALVDEWRAKAKNIEERYSQLHKGQSEIASAAFTTCAEQLEELLKTHDKHH